MTLHRCTGTRREKSHSRSGGADRVAACHRILRRTGLSPADFLLLLVMWTGLTGVLIGAGELVTHWGVFEQFDRHVTAWVVAHRSHALDATMKAITWCGSWIAVAVTGGILVVLVAVRSWHWLF